MCLIGVALGAHPDVPFLVLHNRDEQFGRPTSSLAVREEDGILSAWDVKSGGTWMGLNTRTGHLASLVNFRSKFWQTPNDKKTRGFLVQQFLQHGGPASLTDATMPYLTEELFLQYSYSGFSMIYANLFHDFKSDVPDVYVVSNRPASLVAHAYGRPNSINDASTSGHNGEEHDKHSQNSNTIADHKLFKTRLTPGRCYASSNSFFNDTSWPKVRFMQETLTAAMDSLPRGDDTIEDESELARVCVARVIAGLMRVRAFQDVPEDVLAMSSDSRQEEEKYQHVFVNMNNTDPSVWCTRQQSIALRTKTKVHYFYRDTHGVPKMEIPWRHVVVEADSQHEVVSDCEFALPPSIPSSSSSSLSSCVSSIRALCPSSSVLVVGAIVALAGSFLLWRRKKLWGGR